MFEITPDSANSKCGDNAKTDYRRNKIYNKISRFLFFDLYFFIEKNPSNQNKNKPNKYERMLQQRVEKNLSKIVFIFSDF